MAQTVLAGEHYTSYDLEIQGRNYYAYYIPLKNPDGTVTGMIFAGAPTEDISSFISKQTTNVLFTAIVVAILGIIGALLSANSMTAAVLGAQTAVLDLAEGKLTARVGIKTTKLKASPPAY